MRRLLTVAFAALIALAAGPVPAAAAPFGAAQSQSAPITGTVVDSTGGVIGGAVVSLHTAAGVRETTTDAAGRFSFEPAPRGAASMTVTYDRFMPVTVDVDQARSELRIVLEPVPLTELVTVHAPTPNATSTRTATKTDTPLRDVPQAASLVTKELIADQSMQSLADVTRYMPGIGIAQGEGNRDTPVFRGNSSTSDFFVDGIRDDVQYFRDLYNIERVEAFKGPNAMIFGRGGVGGVINRVVRQAEWMPSREVGLQLGSWMNRRLTADFGQALDDRLAVRLTGVYENSDTYRDGVDLERYGVNPSIAFALGPNTTLRAAYEHFHDDRTADRGVPSFQGAPIATAAETFFGNPSKSRSEVTVNLVSSVVEHRFGSRFTIRSRISYGEYDKFYQNIFPGSVDATGANVSISGYNNDTRRQNLFSQTDIVLSQRTGSIEHRVLAGAELGRQETDNFRLTAFFTTLGATTTEVFVPVKAPTVSLPVEFRPGATDANNSGVATVAALYAQDQIALTPQVQAIVGLRYDRFNVDFHNNRSNADFESSDGLVSPRLGLVYKPVTPLSFYASYTLTYLPRAGEQLSSLSLGNQALDPEEFTNYELGAKWDLTRELSFTAAVYRLDRGNVIAPDPLNPAVSLLVDAQRTKGMELEVSGHLTDKWSVIGGYAFQDGEITRSLSATVLAGATLAHLPKHSFSLWNKYDISRAWGVGLGIIRRGDIFAATDNRVTLPSFTRADAAVFFDVNEHLRAQLNIENLFDAEYFPFAHNNNNITPGSPFALRVGLTTRF